MFKFLILGVWINLILSGTILFSSGKYEELLGPDNEETAVSVNTKTTALPPISIALIRERGVVGYIIMEIAFNHAEEGKSSKMPFELIFRDAIINSFYGNPNIDETKLEELHLEELQEIIKERVTQKVGPDVLFDVLIQNIDYRSMDQIRDNQLRR